MAPRASKGIYSVTAFKNLIIIRNVSNTFTSSNIEDEQIKNELLDEEDIILRILNIIECSNDESRRCSDIYDLFHHRNVKYTSQLLSKVIRFPKIDLLFIFITQHRTGQALECINKSSSDRIRAYRYLIDNPRDLSEKQIEVLLPTLKDNLIERYFLLMLVINYLPKDLRQVITSLQIL